MKFAEDPRAFLRDFADNCTAVPVDGSQAVPFVGILDQPAQILDLGRASAHSIEYELTYITADVTLTRDQAVTVSGKAYTCRQAPRPVDDGVFSTVLLTRS